MQPIKDRTIRPMTLRDHAVEASASTAILAFLFKAQVLRAVDTLP